MLLALLLLQQLLIGLAGINHESFVKADGSISGKRRHHHIHRSHADQDKPQPDVLSDGAPPISNILAEIEEAAKSLQVTDSKVVDETTLPPKLKPMRQDAKFPVINEWACALMCASHAEDGCCTYKDNAKRVDDENDGDNYEEDTGLCEFRAGFGGVDEGQEEWSASQCVAGYSTSKCAEWRPGRCMGTPQELTTASLGLPVWDLVFEDHFDRLTCVPDRNGILRPNPLSWTPEIGYKRGKENQFYKAENVECRNGALIITAQRERAKAESKCEVKGSDDPQLDGEACSVCGPPAFEYGPPCDQTLGDGSPICDCSAGAEYTSGSLVSRRKLEFSYGKLEMRAKIDTRPGAWSSWWAVGDFLDVPWPKNGEIDIMDAFQGMLKASVIHADETGEPSSAIFHGAARKVTADWERHFHTWTMEWDKDYILIQVDRQTLLKLDLSVADPVRTTWPNPFTNDKKFFMILNLAVGGHSGGNASVSEFPVTLEVDYVKYYQKKGRTSR